MQRDQNLLFGILAVQLRRVTPEQLVAAGAAWAVDPSQGLPGRLVAQGALSEKDRALIEDFVARAIADHDGNATRALESFGGEAQVAATFQGSVVCTADGGISTALGAMPGAHYQNPATISAVEETPGRYTHVSESGRGGMGRVLLVHDAFIGRQVALKELLAGIGGAGDTPDTPGGHYLHMLARFLQEARITGRLEHPSIVPVYELGRRSDGTLYYTMKLVRGKTLRDALQGASGLTARLTLLPHVIDLCQAMAYAHSLRVIHRDIKPANVMVGEFGETVVLDWGLAKNLDADDAHADDLAETMQWLQAGNLDRATETAHGAIMGTPAYMPPEQARGEIDRVGACSDVYALGVVLYEVLTGTIPFEGNSVQDVLRKVREEAPRPVDAMEPRAPRELTAIAMRAMAKEPSDRYPSAKELADDLLRFQAGAMVDAYDYKASEYLWRFVGRYRAVLSTAAAALVVLLGLGVYSYASILDARDTAEQERFEAILAHAESDRQREAAEAERERAEEMALRIEQTGYAPAILRAHVRVRNNMLAGARTQLVELPERLRHWEWGYLWSAMDTSQRTLTGHTDSVLDIAFSPCGDWMVTGSRDFTAIVWDAHTGEEMRVLRGHGNWVWSVAFCPAGERIATASWDRTVRVWDAQSGSEIGEPLEHPGWVASVSFSPDGAHILTAGWDHTARVWDASTGELVLTLEGHEDDLETAAYSPDGTRIVTGGWDHTARVWDAATGEELRVLRGHTNVLLGAAFSPDGNRIVTSGWDRTARVWETNTGEKLQRFEGHAGFVPSAQFDPIGTHILTSSWDRTAFLWDADTRAAAHAFTGHGRTVRAAKFSPDGTRIATASEDGTAKIWELPRSAPHRLLDGEWYAALSPDGSQIAAWTDDNRATLWDVESGTKLWDLPEHEDKIWSVAFGPDGARLVSTAEDGRARIWDTASGKLLTVLSADEIPLRTAAFSPCGSLLATGDNAGWLRVWNLDDGAEHFAAREHEYRIRFVAFSPDGAHLVTASSDHTANLWKADDGAIVRTLRGHDDEVRYAVFNPQGTKLVTTSSDRTSRIWDGANGNLLQVLDGHADRVLHAGFSPDGQRLVTGSEDTTVKVWDVHSGDELLSLEDPGQWVGFVAFLSDGAGILACSGEGRSYTWRAAPWTATAWSEPDAREEMAAVAMRLAPEWTRVEASRDSLGKAVQALQGIDGAAPLEPVPGWGLLVTTDEPFDLVPGLSLHSGDLIVRVDGRTPRSQADLRDALEQLLSANGATGPDLPPLRIQILQPYAHRAYVVSHGDE